MNTSINISAEKLVPKAGNGNIRVAMALGILIGTILAYIG